jgi:hypothetical protein
LTVSEAAISDRLLKVRQILEQLYKTLTEDARMSFSGLFARMQYANQHHSLSPDLQMQSNQLRLLCNKIAHDEISEPSPELLDTSIAVLYKLIQFFCPDYSNGELSAYIAKSAAKGFTPLHDSKKQSFLCIVDSWKVQKEGSKETGLELEVVREDGHTSNLLLKNDLTYSDSEGRMYSKLAKALWKYASLRCYELAEVAGRDNFFQSTPLTQVVLEPDFLLDASALAECFSSSGSHPEFFILNRLFSDPSSEAMLQGSMVNSIFDELVFNSEADYLSLFKNGLSSLPIAMTSLGKESALRIFNRVQSDHLPQLKNFVKNLGDAEILLEPSFICPEYGLQGRLDLLANQDGKYSIVELKSGKAHPHDVWLGHQMQVIAYNMIIRSTYGARRINNASILYSVSKENPTRHVVNIGVLEQNLLMCRNRIIGILHILAEQPALFFDWLIASTPVADNPIMATKYERFQALMSTIKDYEYEWFLAQIQRIVREIWFVKIGDNGDKSESSYGHNALWQQSKAEKLTAYNIIPDLIPVSYDRKLVNLRIPPSDEIANFREGDIVVLYSQNTPISKQEILRGVITLLEGDKLQVSIRGGLKSNNRFGGESLWAIEHDMLETSLYSPLASVVKFLQADPAKRKQIMGIDVSVSKHVVIAQDDSSVAEIITRMHKADDLFIIQGPPGTGKTSGLLGTYVQQIYEQSDKHILILSFTNRAVDEICMCLLRKQVPCYRMGNSAAVHEQLLSTEIDGKRFEEISETIRSNRIWLATVQSANAWYQDLLRLTKIDELIIDEASQIIESSILGIIANAPKTVLVGDQNQLPPISVQSPLPYMFMHPALQNIGYGSYHQSLMERLYKVHSLSGNEDRVAMLRLHYRMHNEIASLIGSFYHDQLRAALPQQFLALPANTAIPDFLNHRLIWISCPPSQANNYDPVQVQLAVAILAKLLSSREVDNAAAGIGIVAPFRAMIHALRKEIPAALQDVTIDTVERFQGSERDNIILCLPLRYETNLRQVESLSDDALIDRKLNVALSRARNRVIIMGNIDICRNSQHYAKLIDKIEAKGIIIPADLALKQLT